MMWLEDPSPGAVDEVDELAIEDYLPVAPCSVHQNPNSPFHESQDPEIALTMQLQREFRQIGSRSSGRSSNPIFCAVKTAITPTFVVIATNRRLGLGHVRNRIQLSSEMVVLTYSGT